MGEHTGKAEVHDPAEVAFRGRRLLPPHAEYSHEKGEWEYQVLSGSDTVADADGRPMHRTR